MACIYLLIKLAKPLAAICLNHNHAQFYPGYLRWHLSRIQAHYLAYPQFPKGKESISFYYALWLM